MPFKACDMVICELARLYERGCCESVCVYDLMQDSVVISTIQYGRLPISKTCKWRESQAWKCVEFWPFSPL